jgi:hypothetical protein
VTVGPLALFSTDTGDAWLLDPEDHLAARLARDGDPEDVPASMRTARRPANSEIVTALHPGEIRSGMDVAQGHGFHRRKSPDWLTGSLLAAGMKKQPPLFSDNKSI